MSIELSLEGSEEPPYTPLVIPRLIQTTSDILTSYFKGKYTTFKLIRFAVEKFDELLYRPVFQQGERFDLSCCLHTTLAINQIFLNSGQNHFIDQLTASPHSIKILNSSSFRIFQLLQGASISLTPMQADFNEYNKQLHVTGNLLAEELSTQLNITPSTPLNIDLWSKVDFNVFTFKKFKNDLLSDEASGSSSLCHDALFRLSRAVWPFSCIFHRKICWSQQSSILPSLPILGRSVHAFGIFSNGKLSPR